MCLLAYHILWCELYLLLNLLICFDMLCYVVSCHVMSYHVTSRNVMPCYVIPRYAMLRKQSWYYTDTIIHSYTPSSSSHVYTLYIAVIIWDTRVIFTCTCKCGLVNIFFSFTSFLKYFFHPTSSLSTFCLFKLSLSVHKTSR